MFNKKSLKVTAVALTSFISLGIFGATASEASPRPIGQDYEVTQLAHRNKYQPSKNSHPKKYSEGERNTAAIVGAVVGAIIAKNT